MKQSTIFDFLNALAEAAEDATTEQEQTEQQPAAESCEPCETCEPTPKCAIEAVIENFLSAKAAEGKLPSKSEAEVICLLDQVLRDWR